MNVEDMTLKEYSTTYVAAISLFTAGGYVAGTALAALPFLDAVAAGAIGAGGTNAFINVSLLWMDP